MVVIRGRVAQLGERHAYTVDVTGSSPVPPTREIRNSEGRAVRVVSNGTSGFEGDYKGITVGS